MRSIGMPGPLGDRLGDLHLSRHVAQGVTQLRQRDHLHVAAARRLVGGHEVHVGARLAQRVQHPRLGRDDRRRAGRGARGVAHHPARREHVHALGADVAGGHVLHHRGRAAALGVDQEVGARVGVAHRGDVARADAGVDVALAVPDAHLAADRLLDVGAEEHVRAEEDLGVLAVRLVDVPHDGDGVRRRHAVVGLGLDLGGRVDVHHDDGAGVLGLPGAQLGRGDRVGQRAAGVEVRDQHGLLRAEDRRGLGHEVHAAEDDRLRVGGRRLLREAQGVADEVGHVLHLGHLVVVREDHGAALGGQRAYLGLHLGDVLE